MLVLRILWERIEDWVRENIQAVCLDMSGIYKDVAWVMVPQASVVHDRFMFLSISMRLWIRCVGGRPRRWRLMGRGV
jgi:hypothetical protein